MWPRAEPAVALLLTGLAGWLWGSFLNQLVDRAPRRAPRHGADGQAPAAAPAPPPGPPRGVGWLRPARSLCFVCGRTLAWHDNVPIFAYLWLRGRCRTCGAAIGRRTLWIELAVPILAVAWHAVWLRTDESTNTLVWGLAAGSWALVAAGLLAERRQWPPGFVLLGSALVALAALGLHW